MAIRQPLSTGTSESSIIFYNGGHSHDGISSAFIDTAKYSIYDFTTNFMGTDSRQITQGNNFRDFTNVITKIVKESILGPSGITLTPNQVRAENISAGAVTATSLAANIVLVNNIISSNNYVANVSGWAIRSNGTAEFANTSIRGTITANSLTTPGINIDSAGNLTADNFALYANGAIATPGISISNNGDLTADNFALYANGKIQNGNFSVSAAGVLSATGANISGTIEASSVATPGIIIDANGDLTAGGGATVLFADGSIVTSSGNFGVDASGNLFAENAQVRGELSSETFVTHNRFAVNSSYTRPTVLIDNVNDEFSLNSVNGGLRIGADFMQRYTSGSSFLDLSWDFVNNYYFFEGTVSTSTLSVNNIETIASSVGLNFNGRGIAYLDATNGPGNSNDMAFNWDSPNMYGVVDNAVNAVIGTVSDIRSKSYISNAEDIWLNKTYNLLRVVSFNPVDLLDEDNLHLYPRRLGLIAQEVKSALPDLVVSANLYDEEAFLSVDYLGLVPHLIQAVQDLNNRVKELESEV